MRRLQLAWRQRNSPQNFRPMPLIELLFNDRPDKGEICDIYGPADGVKVRSNGHTKEDRCGHISGLSCEGHW